MINILTVENDFLRTPTKKVEQFDTRLRLLVRDLKNKCQNILGAGLAANQIGQDLSVFVAINEDGKYIEYVNPEIEFLTTDLIDSKELCFSCPGVEKVIKRCPKIKVAWYDVKGNKKEDILENLHACIVQHEFDHLKGKLIIDKEYN